MMKPIQDHETWVWPEDLKHVCSKPGCGAVAEGLTELDQVFGWRRMGDELHSVRIQAQCRCCRREGLKGLTPAHGVMP